MTAHSTPSTNATQSNQSKQLLWTGRIMSGVPVLYLFLEAVSWILNVGPAVAVIVELGYPAHLVSWLGFALLGCLILYVIPHTATLGAILLTGHLGGAAATNVRVEDPWFLFPVLVAVLVWGGLYLRDERLRELIPLRQGANGAQA